MLPFTVLKVNGDSMHPTIESGAFVFICRPAVYLSKKLNSMLRYQVGDVVAVRHRKYGQIIKRISGIKYSKKGQVRHVYLTGDNTPKSVSTQQMGAVAMNQIIGKVYHVVNPK